MSKVVQVRKIGSSYGVILSKELLQELWVEEGDSLFVVRTPDGIHLTRYDPDLADAVEAGRDYMEEHSEAFRELAK